MRVRRPDTGSVFGVARPYVVVVAVAAAGCTDDRMRTEGLIAAVADLNGDGYADLITNETNYEHNDQGGTTRVQLNVGDRFSTVQEMRLGTSIAVGDFNGDGATDFAAGWREHIGGPASAYIDLWLNDGTAHFSLVRVPPPTGKAWDSTVQAADVDGDGSDELLAPVTEITSEDISAVEILFGPDFVRSGSIDALYFKATGDFNGDGHLDLVTDNTVRLGDGTGIFAPPISLGFPTPLYPTMAAADVNGDSLLDLVIVGGSMSWTIDVLLGDGTGAFLPIESHVASAKASFGGRVIAPFESDGRLGVAVGGADDHKILYYPVEADGSLGEVESMSAGIGNSRLFAGDFDGDGLADLAATGANGEDVTIIYNER